MIHPFSFLWSWCKARRSAASRRLIARPIVGTTKTVVMSRVSRIDLCDIIAHG